jgi:hypothetical protein
MEFLGAITHSIRGSVGGKDLWGPGRENASAPAKLTWRQPLLWNKEADKQ